MSWLTRYWRPRLAYKREWSLFTAAIHAGLNDKEFPDMDVFGALHAWMFIELQHLGFERDSIDRWLEYCSCPSDELIQRKIDQFIPHYHNDMLQVPLSLEQYKNRFSLLGLMCDLEDMEEDDVDNEISAAFWMSQGLFLALHSLDPDIMDQQTISAAASHAGSMRLGRTYSRANIAIDYAISHGYDTGTKVRNYFETEPVIDEIETEVFRDNDLNGDLVGFRFHNAATGQMSKLLMISSLSSTVSQVKKRRLKRKSLTRTRKH